MSSIDSNENGNVGSFDSWKWRQLICIQLFVFRSERSSLVLLIIDCIYLKSCLETVSWRTGRHLSEAKLR